MKRLFIEFTALLLLCGCSSTRHTENTLVSNENKVVERIDTIRTHDTVRVENTVRDSVVIQTRNDTVFVEKWKIHYKVRDAISKSDEVKIIRDTVTKYVAQTKTITEKPKPKDFAAIVIIITLVLAVVLLDILILAKCKK